MPTLLTSQNITFALGVVAILFGVFRYFKDPQEAADKTDALLSQKIQWMIDGTETRFKGIQDNFQSLLLQSNNHIHTVDTKVEALNATMTSLSNEITRLATIIEERIPKK